MPVFKFLNSAKHPISFDYLSVRVEFVSVFYDSER